MTAIGTSVLLFLFLATVHASERAVAIRMEAATPDANLDDNGARAEKKDQKVSMQKEGKSRFTISKETTYVTGPLDKDGFVDFPAAINERWRQGVTPENNANVLIWKALGPHPEGTTMPPEYFQWMGIQAPSEKGDYFIKLPRYAKERLKIDSAEAREEIDDQLNRNIWRPWTPKDYPNLASWLKANERPLALVVEATKRSRYFSPLVPGKKDKARSGLIRALMPTLQQCREIANALAARAMLRAGPGADDDAWEDLLACHRLGRLVARGGTFIDTVVGIAIDSTANKADLAFLDRTKPTANRIAKYLLDLRNLPPHPSIADKVDFGERIIFLDNVMMIGRYGMRYLDALADGPPKEPDPVTEAGLTNIEWDLGLQSANHWYDRLAAAMREKDRPSRQKKLDQIRAELEKLREKIIQSGGIGGRKIRAKALGKAITDIWIGVLLPAMDRVQNAADRAQQEQDNLILAFALAWYQQDHGRYPKRLDELAPKYLAEIPRDLFSGKVLIYHPRENGYLLYSVGVNGKDEEGHGPEDKLPGDDLSVRMPVLESRRE
jgi:hypothetical protein